MTAASLILAWKEEMEDLLTNAEDLGEATGIEIFERLMPIEGLSLVDVGCGSGTITRQLAERGATVLGVEPDPIQAEKNRNAEPLAGLSFAEAPGQDLPLEDAAVDGVVFSYSLHHVPRELMDAALTEALRVLKPGRGFLYVMEPLLTGSMEAVYRPFHDESEVRSLAYEALARTVAPRFAEAREVRYHEPIRYESYESFVGELVDFSYCGFTRERVDIPEVRALFEAGRCDDGFVFTQKSRVNLYTGLSAGT